MNKKNWLILAAAITLLGIYGAWNVFGPVVKAPEKKFFYVRTGSTYERVKDSLLSQHILPNGLFFHLLSTLSKYPEKVKPGKYEITDGSSTLDLVRMLKSGRQKAVRLVINKVRTRYELAGKLARNFEIDSLSALKYLSSNDSLSKLKVDTNSLLLIVIPNSYLMYWNSPISRILATLKHNQSLFWNSSRKSKLQEKGITDTQAYIIASLVEEETNMAGDKGKIASVYFNRLGLGMKLDADPTVRFAHNDFTIKRVMQKHLTIESPYNTYRNKGLPPGPICTPSIATIDSVLNAPKTNYLFFAAKADFSGYSSFAATYPEHLRNAAKYQAALDSLLSSPKNNP